MAVLPASLIFSYALDAGFSPSEATTMTAIALAESGGRTGAHNSSGENSVGLWQINLDAHAGRVGGRDLTDPRVNAEVAYEIYMAGGGSISPWTVTHTSKGSRYLDYRGAALSAAAANGYDNVQPNWSGWQAE